jgi:hypothetical protein
MFHWKPVERHVGGRNVTALLLGQNMIHHACMRDLDDLGQTSAATAELQENYIIRIALWKSHNTFCSSGRHLINTPYTKAD